MPVQSEPSPFPCSSPCLVWLREKGSPVLVKRGIVRRGGDDSRGELRLSVVFRGEENGVGVMEKGMKMYTLQIA